MLQMLKTVKRAGRLVPRSMQRAHRQRTSEVLKGGCNPNGELLAQVYCMTSVNQCISLMNKFRIVIAVVLACIFVHTIDRSFAAEKKYQFTHDWVSDHAPVWIKHLQEFKGKPNIRALEIGTFEGRGAIWFLENILTDPTSSITCIDVFGDYGGPFEHRYDHNIKVSGFSHKVKKIKGSSQTVLRTLEPNSYDFIYIDGSHVAKDVLMDAVLSWDLLKVGGIIIFDDYRWHEHDMGRWARPQIAIDAFLHVFKPYTEVRHKEYQIVVKKKDEPNSDFLAYFGEEPGQLR